MAPRRSRPAAPAMILLLAAAHLPAPSAWLSASWPCWARLLGGDARVRPCVARAPAGLALRGHRRLHRALCAARAVEGGVASGACESVPVRVDSNFEGGNIECVSADDCTSKLGVQLKVCCVSARVARCSTELCGRLNPAYTSAHAHSYTRADQGGSLHGAGEKELQAVVLLSRLGRPDGCRGPVYHHQWRRCGHAQ